MTLSDGKSVVFEPSGVASVWRPASVVLRDVYSHTLEYYGSGGTPLCTTSAAEKVDKLCAIRGDTAGIVHFSAYSASHGYVTRIQAGVDESNFSAAAGYTYDDAHPVYNALGVVQPETLTVMTGRYFENSSGQPLGEDGESYEYTSSAYYRPDLAGTTDLFQDANTFIISDSGASRALLSVTRAGGSIVAGGLVGGEFVSAHRYDDWGKAVTSESSGEFLRFEFADSFRDGVAGTTIVVNESSGEVTEFRYDENGRITDVAGDCSCGTDPGGFTYDANGLMTSRRTEPPGSGVANPTTGIRTTYSRDTRGRVALRQQNWEGDPNVLSTSPVADVVSATRYTFDSSDERLTEVSSVFSAPCTTPGNSYFTCPGSWDEPGVIYDYETGGDYNDTYNAGALGNDPTQVVRRGLTLENTNSSSLVQKEYDTEFRYLGDGRLQSMTYPDGVVVAYQYYGTTGDLDEERLYRVTESGTAIREFRNYDASGRAGTVENRWCPYSCVKSISPPA